MTRPMSALSAAALLRSSARAFAHATLQALQQDSPELLARGLPATFADPLSDCEVRLRQFAESVAVQRPELFAHALGWYKVAFAHRGVDAEYLPRSVAAMAVALQRELPDECREVALLQLQVAVAGLPQAPSELPSVLAGEWPLVGVARRFLLAVLEGRGDDALLLVRRAMQDGAGVPQVHDEVLAPIMQELGRMWLMAEIPIADEHFGSRQVERALAWLDTTLPTAGAAAPRVVTLSVAGNQHDLGLRMVAQRLTAAGLQVWHLGADMPLHDLEWMLADRQVDLLAVSASLLLHLGNLQASIAGLRRGLGARCPRILVGGQPFVLVPDLGALVGADAAAGNAGDAVTAARALLRT